MPKEELKLIELEKFVKQTIEGIKRATERSEVRLAGTIKFEVSIVKIIKGEGGVKIYVVGGGGEYQKESIAKISFEVSPYLPGVVSSGGNVIF